MTERKPAPEGPLFARKGEATPAPAVGYVSVRILQGKPERRRGEGEREGPERRLSAFERLFGVAASAALAPAAEVAPQAPPAAAPEAPPPALRQAPGGTEASGAGPSLSLLIHRHLQPKAPSPAPPPAAAAAPPWAAPAERPAPKSKATPGKRHQLTVRIPESEYERFKALADATGQTNQDILAKAVHDILD